MDKNRDLLAKKYATAFYNCFMQDSDMELYCELIKIANFLKQKKRVLALLDVAALTLGDKKMLAERLFAPYSLSQYIRPLIDLLVRNQRLSLIELVIEKLGAVYAQRHHLLSVYIASSLPLNEMQLKTIRSFLSIKTGKHILLTPVVDKSLIAGIRITSSTYGWEYSIARQLRTLRHLLDKQGI